jgi:hypothetical protein
MHQRRMPTYIIQWVQEFTTDKLLSFGFDGISEDSKPFTGALSQGSPVSPILFAIAENAMLEDPANNNGHASSASYVVMLVLFRLVRDQAILLLILKQERKLNHSEHLLLD